VGSRVGEADGSLEGEEVGKGVGFIALYVGTKLGEFVGAPDGAVVVATTDVKPVL